MGYYVHYVRGHYRRSARGTRGWVSGYFRARPGYITAPARRRRIPLA